MATSSRSSTPRLRCRSSSNASREESPLPVVYQGLEESFTNLACRSYFKAYDSKVSYKPLSRLKDIIVAITSGEASYAVVALESSTHGLIYSVYDTLLNSEGTVYIAGEMGQLEEHGMYAKRLVSGRPIALDSITEVYGHPHDLQCCSEYLDMLDSKKAAKGLPDVVRIPATDSVEACITVAKKGEKDNFSAAIAGSNAAEAYGLEVLTASINNDRNAETRYVVLARRNASSGSVWDPLLLCPEPPKLGSPISRRNIKASIAVGLRNVSGSIFRLTSCFAFRDLNIVRIESRPSSIAAQLTSTSVLTNRRHWDLIFFIDYEPSDNAAVNRALLVSLRECSLWIRELGCYFSGLMDVEAAPAQWKEIIDVITYC